MRLIEWNALSVLIRGERLQSFVRTEMARNRAPVEDLAMRFAEGELRVSGRVRSFMPFAVPFEVAIRRVAADSGRIRLFLESAAAFGIVPIPKLLLHLAGGNATPEGVDIDAATGSVVISLDRFLPSFVDVEIEEVRIVAAGLAVSLGPGGADPPEGFGGTAS